MAYPIRPNYKQTYLFPHSLEEFIPPDHPARFIRAFVDALDLQKLGFYEECESIGRPKYSANLLLKLVVYGYFHRIWSYRAPEAAVRKHLGAMGLTGRRR